MSGYNAKGVEGKELRWNTKKYKEGQTESFNHKPHYIDERILAAEERHSFALLLPYPCLLFRWQIKHPEDNKRVATIASHQLGKHLFCGEKCRLVEDWMRKMYQTRIAEIFAYRAGNKNQQDLL